MEQSFVKWMLILSCSGLGRKRGRNLDSCSLWRESHFTGWSRIFTNLGSGYRLLFCWEPWWHRQEFLTAAGCLSAASMGGLLLQLCCLWDDIDISPGNLSSLLIILKQRGEGLFLVHIRLLTQRWQSVNVQLWNVPEQLTAQAADGGSAAMRNVCRPAAWKAKTLAGTSAKDLNWYAGQQVGKVRQTKNLVPSFWLPKHEHITLIIKTKISFLSISTS